MKYIVKKIALIIMLIYRRDLNLDILSIINPKTYNKLKGNKKYKIVIKNSILGGDVSASYGCKMDNIICLGKVDLQRFVSLSGPGTRISSRIHGIEIGSFSSIASNVIIQEDYHRIDKVSTYFMNNNIFKDSINSDIYSKGKIIIEEDVWIGSNSIVLSGVKIGRGSIIGAGSIVTKDIPRYSIAVGNPARVIKKRFPEYIIEKLESSKWWNMEIDEIIKLKSNFNKNLNHLELNNDIFS